MDIDALTLARLQFAFTVSFHIIFPAISIGLASYLAVLEGLWLFTGRVVFLDLFNYWKKIFAVAFGMGVVSGIVMSYQFGTNWSVFSDKAGPVIGPLMGYEVLTAFFLEAGFLGVMLFGLSRVGPRLHFLATLMVALGTFISAFWILVGQQLDADAGRLRDQRRRPVRSGGLGRDHLQPVVPLPARAHAAGRVPQHGIHRRWHGRLAPAARFDAAGLAHHVLDGDVDGRDRRAAADRRRRLPRAQHAASTSPPRSRRWKVTSKHTRVRRSSCSAGRTWSRSGHGTQSRCRSLAA